MEEERKGGLIHLSRTFGPEKLQRWIHLWVIMICYQKKQLSWSLFGPRINFYLIAHLSSANPGSQSPSVWVSVSISAFRLLLLLFLFFPLLSSFSCPSPLSESHDLLISHFPEELPLSPQPLYIALVLTLSRLLPTIFRYSQRTCHYLNVSCWFMALGRHSSSPGNMGWASQSCCLPSPTLCLTPVQWPSTDWGQGGVSGKKSLSTSTHALSLH